MLSDKTHLGSVEGIAVWPEDLNPEVQALLQAAAAFESGPTGSCGCPEDQLADAADLIKAARAFAKSVRGDEK